MQPGGDSQPSMSMPSSPCCICGGPVENGHISTCYGCSRTVHIQWNQLLRCFLTQNPAQMKLVAILISDDPF